MKSSFREIASISTSMKAAISSIEPQILSLPVPNSRIPPNASPGEIILAMQTHQTADPVRDLKTVRREWTRKFKQQSARLDDIEKHGYQLQQMLAHIKSGASMPDGVDDAQLTAAVRVLRTASQTGENVGPTIDRARISVNAGLAEIRRIKGDVLATWKNAAETIWYKHGARHFEQCSAGETDLDRALRWEIKADVFERVHQKRRAKNLARAQRRAHRRMAGGMS